MNGSYDAITVQAGEFGPGELGSLSQVVFWVSGDPKPKGSMKCIGRRGKVAHVLTEDDSSGDRKRWRTAIAEIADQARMRRTIDVAVRVHVTFYIPRPASHYGTGRNADVVKDSAPAFPTAKSIGDTDKMQRNLGDALVDGKVLTDDSLIVDWFASKRWAPARDRSGAMIRVLSGVSRPIADRGGARSLAAGCCTWCGHLHQLPDDCPSCTVCRRREWFARTRRGSAHDETPTLY